MAEFITFKRWKLRDGRREAELLELVREEIKPHYRQLPGCLKIGLLHILGTRSYLALQYWQDRAAWQAATSSDDYEAGWRPTSLRLNAGTRWCCSKTSGNGGFVGGKRFVDRPGEAGIILGIHFSPGKRLSEPMHQSVILEKYISQPKTIRSPA